MLITVSGLPGSGTTTTAKHVAARLDLDLVPGGEVFRAMAAERGMSLPEFGQHAVEHPEVDVELDTRIRAHVRRGDAVVESRLAGWLAIEEKVPALTVWVDCHPHVRAERVAEREDISVERALADNDQRQRIERARYLALYDIDLADLSVYDLVVDSGALDQLAVVDVIVAAAESRFPPASPRPPGGPS